MNWVESIQQTIDYIENNLDSELDSEILAEKIYTSSFNFQRSDFSERGYVVKETGAVYYTQDMDKTLKWFKEVLGWYGQIEARDESGTGTYGCVNNIPLEIEVLHLAPFTGIHMFKGEPHKMMVGFMMVQGIERLHSFVEESKWEKITEVVNEPWGGKTCEVTTIDGSILKFFEV